VGKQPFRPIRRIRIEVKIKIICCEVACNSQTCGNCTKHTHSYCGTVEH